MSNDYISQNDARRLGISRSLLKQAMEDGRVSHIRTGLNREKVSKSDILKLMGIPETNTQKVA